MLDAETLREAERVAKSDALNAVLDNLIKRYTDEWVSSGPTATEAREIAWHKVQAIHAVRIELQSVAKNAEVSAYNRRLRGKTV